MIDQPKYEKGVEMELSIETDEAFKYPMGKEWNVLKVCVKSHRDKMKVKEGISEAQVGESSTVVKKVARKIITSS